MFLTQDQMNFAVNQIIAAAQAQPDHRLPIRDAIGRVVATVEFHDAPTRPQDMPRHLRPKRQLSKRQRDQAKRQKLERRILAG